MGLAHGVAAGGQGDGFLVVHRHAAKGHAHVHGGFQRIRLAVYALRVHVNQAHHDCGQGVFQIAFTAVAAALATGGRKPFFFGAPVGVLFWLPDVFAAKAKAKGLQAHGFVGHGTRQNNQVGPAQPVAVLLFDRPQQAAGLVQIGVVGPGVQRGKALATAAATAAPVGNAVGARRVPGHADHQAAVVAPIGRPPALARGHQGFEVVLERLHIEFFDLVAVVKARIHRVGFAVVLVQDVEVQRLGPPIHLGHSGRSHATMHHRALAGRITVAIFHFPVLSVTVPGRQRTKPWHRPRLGSQISCAAIAALEIRDQEQYATKPS